MPQLKPRCRQAIYCIDKSCLIILYIASLVSEAGEGDKYLYNLRSILKKLSNWHYWFCLF